MWNTQRWNYLYSWIHLRNNLPCKNNCTFHRGLYNLHFRDICSCSLRIRRYLKQQSEQVKTLWNLIFRSVCITKWQDVAFKYNDFLTPNEIIVYHVVGINYVMWRSWKSVCSSCLWNLLVLSKISYQCNWIHLRDIHDGKNNCRIQWYLYSLHFHHICSCSLCIRWRLKNENRFNFPCYEIGFKNVF